MKIEFGFQANCSELITYLGARTKEEIANVMVKLSEVLGYTWRVADFARKEKHDGRYSLNSFSILLPNDHIRELLVVNIDAEHGSNSFGVLPSSIIPLWNDLIPEFVKDHLNEVTHLILDETYEFSDLFNLNDYLFLAEIPESDPVVIDVGQYSSFQHLKFSNYDCEEGNELNFRIESNIIEDFPFFHWFRKQLGKDFGSHDGGTVRYYIGWMALHFLPNNQYSTLSGPQHRPLEHGLIKEFGEDMVDQMKAYPPRPGAKELSKEDIQRILAELGITRLEGIT